MTATPRAMGANSQLLGKTEATYGTAPSGNWAKLPFNSTSVGGSQGLVANDSLGFGRDALQPGRDVVDVKGDVALPFDLFNLGHWLNWAFGTDTVIGSGAPYTHSFASGAVALPSFALERGHPDLAVPQYFLLTGLGVDSLAFTQTRKGMASFTAKLIGQNDVRSGSSGGGTPTLATFTRFNNFTASIKLGGTALANITSSKFSYNNNLTTDDAIRSDGLISGWDPGAADCTGEIVARFADTTLLADAEAATTVALAFAFAIDANNSFTFTVNNAILGKPSVPIKGPGGLDVTFPFQAFQLPGSAVMVSVALLNSQAAAYT